MGLANLTGSFPVAQLNGTVTNQGNLWGGSVSDNMSLWCHVKSYTAGGQYVDIWVHPNDTIAIYYFEGYSNAVGNCTVGGNASNFYANLGAGLLVVVSATVAVTCIAGFSFLGVGLNAVSVLAIFKATAYMGLWSVVSVLGSCLLLAIPIFGVLLFLFLTLVYSIGVFQSIGFGSG